MDVQIVLSSVIEEIKSFDILKETNEREKLSTLERLMVELIELKLRHRWTDASLNDVIQLIREIAKQTETLQYFLSQNYCSIVENPLSTTNTIFKYFGWVAHSDKWKSYVTCDGRCRLEDEKQFNSICNVCEERNKIGKKIGKEKGGEYLQLDTKKNVRFWYKKIQYAVADAMEVTDVLNDLIAYKPGSNYNEDGSITDFRNGTFNAHLFHEHKLFLDEATVDNKGLLLTHIIVPILISSDSLTLFRHSVKDGYTSLSPMFMSILSLHPQTRYKYVSCIGLIPGPRPNNVELFYYPFFQELKHLENEGFVHSHYKVRVVLIMCTGDYRWIPKLTLHLSIPSPHACHICSLIGKYSIEHNQGQYRTQYCYLHVTHHLRKVLKLSIIRKKGQSALTHATNQSIYDCPSHNFKLNDDIKRNAEKVRSSYKPNDAIEKCGQKALPILLNVLRNYQFHRQMLFDPMHIVLNLFSS